MIERTVAGLQVSGDVTMDTVSSLFSEGLKLGENSAVPGDLTVDFLRLEKVDSSAVSLMLVWLREAQRNKVNLRFANVPANLMSLVNLYGLTELLMLGQD